MSLTAGIVESPDVGEPTLFNVVTKAGTEMVNCPLATIGPDVEMVEVPDSRLAHIQELIPVKKIVYATSEFADIAGLVKGASKGEGLKNKFLENTRQTDVIVHVVRAFDDNDIISITDKVGPEGNINTVNLESATVDLDTVNRRIGKIQKVAQQNDKEARAGMTVLSKLKPILEEGEAARSVDLNEDEQKIVKGLFLLISRPVICVANIAESSMANPENDRYYQIVKKHAESENTEVLSTSAATEEEITSVDEDERKEFLKMEGVEESGFDRLVKAIYHILGFHTFFAADGSETRAWILHESMKAPQVVDVVHSGSGRGLTRAEAVSFDDLDKLETTQKAKEAGKLRLEGKDYVVRDDDITGFRFSV